MPIQKGEILEWGFLSMRHLDGHEDGGPTVFPSWVGDTQSSAFFNRETPPWRRTWTNTHLIALGDRFFTSRNTCDWWASEQ